MKCLETERLISYAYRLIDEPAASEVCKHLEECVRCREIVEQHGRLDAMLSEWQSAEPSPEFDVRVREAVEAFEAQREGWGFWGWQWARGLALAALGLMIVAGVVRFGHNHRADSHSSQVATRQSQQTTGARISGQTPNQQTQADAAEAQMTSAQQLPDLRAADATSSDDKDALAMEDYDLAANFDLLSEIPKGERRVAN
jgi:anti-sigma factor RsiW